MQRHKNLKNPNIALIVAAGRGSRISDYRHDDTPKQYVKIAGKSVLERTINAFQTVPEIDFILVVIHKDDQGAYQEIHSDNQEKLLNPVLGGDTRQESVFEGLKALSKYDRASKVLIHDAARPFITSDTIVSVIAATDKDCGALPALPIADTIKRVNRSSNICASTIDRTGMFAAQTPQCFLLEDITQLHQKAANEPANSKTAFTDDASIFEAWNKQVRIVGGKSSNFKITTLEDLERAQAMAEKDETQMVQKEYRTGSGYDVHAFEDGDGVILCGITIPHDRKLKGHSDADVGLHALTDALLGTIGVGDIGTFFPPSDPKWKGASSDQFLVSACEKISEKGGRICNLDVTLICEAPNIGPHRINMIQNIADICNILPDRVSVKATTNEKLGAIGRREGIAAIASASVEFDRNCDFT